MNLTFSSNVPKNVEEAAVNYLTAAYNGNAEQVSNALDPKVKITVYDNTNGQQQTETIIEGQEQVVSIAMAIGQAIRSTENFGLSLDYCGIDAGKNFLVVTFEQGLVIQQSSESKRIQIHPNGMQFWECETLDREGINKKIIFTAGTIFQEALI
jgi:hypothetical protein